MAKRYEELTIEDDLMFGKPIRLDVYTKDQKRIYDAEMQKRNHHSSEQGEILPGAAGGKGVVYLYV